MRLSLALAIGLTTALLAAVPASAGTVCAGGGIATFAAADVGAICAGGTNDPSEVNALTVAAGAGGAIVFTDSKNAVIDGDGPGGCTVSGNTGTCPATTSFTFDLGAGDDTATVGSVSAAGTSTGGDGADHLTGSPLGDALDGGAGADTIDGGAGSDTLTGGDGNDSITGGAGDDGLSGGAGPDTLSAGPGFDSVSGDDGDDTESGGDDDDRLDGGDAPGCSGGAGNDILSGDGGNDVLCGGPGPAGGSDNDSLNGGDGEDIAFYRRAAAVAVSLDNIGGDGEAGESDNVHADVEDLAGGAGADSLVGSDGRNVLDGGAGADSLSGLGGNDVLTDSSFDTAADKLDGGAGDDAMAAGRGADSYLGGDGEDAVTDYSGRAFAVNVTLDGVADDGSPGEGDNVGPDVEDVTGGSGADTLIGNASDNQLDGGSGDDVLSGGDGNDGVSGGAGRDAIDGGSGRDDLDGGAGADSFNTRDAVTDRVDCGGGTDGVQGEARDDISGNCENLDIAPPTPVVIKSVQVTRAGFVIVTMTCPAAERSCVGAIIVKTVRRVSSRFIKLGQINYRLRGGDSKVFKAKIATKDRKPLKRARRVKVRAVVTNVNPDTTASTNATKLATVTTRGL